MDNYKEFNFKKFGYFDFNKDILEHLSMHDFSDFIKIVYLKSQSNFVLNLSEYTTEKDALFFINAGQYYQFGSDCIGTMIYYNRDFYCVEIHDKEVACDGILFHNVYEIPAVYLDNSNVLIFNNTLNEIKLEIELNDSMLEEMLRILLKSIIIKSTRIWKQTHNLNSEDTRDEVDFLRKFSQLVEKNFITYHSVADYAALLNISPKALNKRITRNSETSPNEIIKKRIVLEAKLLLVHTTLSVKEISYKLGYDDSSYFTRLFTKQTTVTPQNFRLQYQQPKPGYNEYKLQE